MIKVKQKNKKQVRMIVLSVMLLTIMSFGYSQPMIEADNIQLESQFTGTTFINNITSSDINIDGDIGESEWDCTPKFIGDNTNNASVYFRYDYSYLYVGVRYNSDLVLNSNDGLIIYFDFNTLETLDEEDVRIITNGDGISEFGKWNKTDYDPLASLPSGFDARVDNNSLGVNYEIKVPIQNLEAPFNSSLGWNVFLYDNEAPTQTLTLDQNFMETDLEDISDWDELKFNYADPTLSEFSINHNGGYSNGTIFRFEITYTSSVNIHPLTFKFNISNVENGSIFIFGNLGYVDYNDDDYTDGKTYYKQLVLSELPEGKYNVSVIFDDNVQETIYTYPTQITLLSFEKPTIVFDGMNVEYDYEGFLGASAYFDDTYSLAGAGMWSVSSDTNYFGASSSIRGVDENSRIFSVDVGSYPFDTLSHEYSFIPRDLELGDTLDISVIGDGDVEFTYSSSTTRTYNNKDYNCYYFYSSVGNAYYEMSTGLLLYGSFDPSGLGILNQYTLTLSDDNIFENLFTPIIENVSIEDEISDVNDVINFTAEIVDFDGDADEIVQIQIMNGTELVINDTMTLNTEIGIDRSTGVTYEYSTTLWNTTFSEGWKNYTTEITVIEDYRSDMEQKVGPNVSYVDLFTPVLASGYSDPVGPIGNNTAVTFYVTYSDGDNNAPSKVELNLPQDKYPMMSNGSTDFIGGVDYSVIVPSLPNPGAHNYNFTVFNQDGTTLDEQTGGSINVFDEPPDVYIESPTPNPVIGTEVTIEITSTASDVKEIFYNVTDLSTGINQTYVYSAEHSKTFPMGNYELTAWVKDYSDNLNHTSVFFTTTNDPHFKILISDMNNCSVDTYYTNALEGIGFKDGRDFDEIDYFPTIGDLAGYDILILTTANSEYDFTVNASVLDEFSSNGGAIYIAGTGFIENNINSFASDRLGILSSYSVAESEIIGIEGNPISGDYPNDYIHFYHNLISSDVNFTSSQQYDLGLTLQSSDDILFAQYNLPQDAIGMYNDNGTNRVVYTTFELGRIVSSVNQQDLLERIIYWLANSSSFTLESPSMQYYQSLEIWFNGSSVDPSIDTVWYSLYNNTASEWVFENRLYTGNEKLTLEEADYTIYAFANNTWGFVAQPLIQSFRLDITAPDFEILSPLNITYSNFNDSHSNYTVSGLHDDDAYYSYSCYNYSSGVYVYQNFLAQGDYFTYNPNLLDEGYYRFEVTAYDDCSNTISKNVNFTVNFMPNVSIISPGDSRISDSTPELNIIATDNDGILIVYYDIYNQDLGTYFVQDYPYLGLPGEQTIPLPDGNYRIYAYANDTNNIASINDVYFDFEIDTVGPEIDVYLDLEKVEEKWISDDEVDIAFWSDESDLDSLWYRIRNVTSETWLTENNITYDGTIFFGTPFNYHTISDLEEGEYSVFFWSNDTDVGNEIELIRYFSVDRSAPTVDSIVLDSQDINVPIEMIVNGDDITSITSITLYYKVDDSATTYSMAMTQRDALQYNATLPGWGYGVNITYWMDLTDSFEHLSRSENMSFVLKGLASDQDYEFDYVDDFDCLLNFNTTTAGDIIVEFTNSNPESVAIVDADEILSYIEISYEGNMDGAQLRFYYSFGVEFDQIHLMHFKNGAWEEIELAESADGTYIYANLDSFSTFALIQIEPSGIEQVGDNPVLLTLIIVLSVLFIAAMTLFIIQRKKYVEEVENVDSKGMGKKDKSYQKYQDSAITSDFEADNVMDSIKKKKAQATSEIKRKKHTVKTHGETAETSAVAKPDGSKKVETKESEDDVNNVEYYCESCKKSFELRYDADEPAQLCPDCGKEMGVKVTCKDCGAAFQVSANQYVALLNAHTPCPKCKKPLA